ncbi:hypothetical protein D9758_014412 [Tetrapyrgos nigripes]|uniref:Retroviral polymerase SH3-like domain-containing protein n=1 Tax=Tetrapyrgos nigripes TaxID=182062 RepID=A0A8H5CNP9_9AGAR|nr:hypothetical protein D9758_014412 [Tetrapyrgos nigripes]
MAMLYATYIGNHTLHKAIDMKTFYEKQFRTIPDISELHPFSSIVYVKCTLKPNKLEDQAIEGHWLGPEKESQGYYIYWPKKKSITVTNQPIQLSEEEDNDFINLEQKVPESDTVDPVIEITKPIAPKIITGRRPITRSMMKKTGGVESANLLTTILAQVTSKLEAYNPLSVVEAKCQPDLPKWKEAMDKEMRRHKEQGTFIPVYAPSDANILTGKWVYRTKKDEHGKVKEHQAQLVVCEYNQIPEVNYFPDETFTSVAKMT